MSVHEHGNPSPSYRYGVPGNPPPSYRTRPADASPPDHTENPTNVASPIAIRHTLRTFALLITYMEEIQREPFPDYHPPFHELFSSFASIYYAVGRLTLHWFDHTRPLPVPPLPGLSALQEDLQYIQRLSSQIPLSTSVAPPDLPLPQPAPTTPPPPQNETSWLTIAQHLLNYLITPETFHHLEELTPWAEPLTQETLHWLTLRTTRHITYSPIARLYTDKPFLMELLTQRQHHLDQLHTWIHQEVAARWALTRLATIDRLLITLALTEHLLIREPTPLPVILREYGDLANEYSLADSPRFIHGVLHGILETLNQSTSTS